jgi:uncharacterized tellurite resistance protein B-like protein
MNASMTALQARKDRLLREKLAADSGVKRAINKIEERSSGFGFFQRHRLLAGGLRLTRRMAPEIADALAACRELTGLQRPVELYVRPSTDFNAFCVKNPAGPVIVALTSGLVEAFTPAELRFVLGHELGHVAFDHFGIPMPLTATIQDLGGTLVSRPKALELHVWTRSAEISADRVGLVCSRDPQAAAMAFFKLASGLTSGRVHADLEAYASQVDSLASAPDARAELRDEDDTLDCFSTHPYSGARVRALVAFSRSQAYAKLIGESGGGIGDDELEAIVERDLALMEPSYLEDKTRQSELMRKLLYVAGVSVAAANGEVAQVELDALRALLGAAQTSGKLDVEKARKDLDEAIAAAVKEVGLAGRAKLVQHLTIIAAADGEVDDAEVHEMHRIAGLLGVDTQVVEQTLAGAAAPMD